MKALIFICLFSMVACEKQESKTEEASRGCNEYGPMEALDGRPAALIVGDSISIGYTPTVKGALSGLQVIHNTCNAKTTRHGVKWIEAWSSHAPSWEFCTINHGLHDVSIKNNVPIEEYIENLEIEIQTLQARCNKVLFINTTATPNPDIDPKIDAFNAAAEDLMSDYSIPVCDLNSVAQGLDHLRVAPNDVHFVPEGYEILGQAVIDCINDL
jgi:hypothetical protein